MPLRQLSKPRSIASAMSSKYTTTSTVRVVAAAGELSAGAVGSSTTISVSDIGTVCRLLRDETGLGHEILVQRVVLFEEREHVLAREEYRFQCLLFHVVLVFRGLRQLLEEVDIKRGLLRCHLARKEHGAEHQILDVQAFFLARRNVVPRLGFGDLALVGDAFLVEHAKGSYLSGGPAF